MSSPSAPSSVEPIPVVKELAEAMVRMHFKVSPGKYALLALPKEALKAACDLVAKNGHDLGQVIVERDVVTLLVTEGEAAALRKAYPNARVEEDMRMITFTVPMDWTVVGFLSRVAGTLSRNGIPIGAVCGFYRDHLIVPEKYLQRARTALDAEIPEEK